MFHLCAVIIASLCVPQKYIAVSQFFSMYTRVDADGHPLKDLFDPAEVKRTGIEIHAIESDNIRDASPLGFDRICAKAWCVYYRKHCKDKGLTCSYVYSVGHTANAMQEWRQGLAISQDMEIRAPSKSAMAKLQRELHFIVHFQSEKDFVSVPLSTLDHESPDVGHLRYCMRSIWVQGCPRPERPQFRDREHP
jgi:hypothetical protein